MTITVTFNGVTYTDDQMDNGNHLVYFFPMLQNLMIVCAQVAAQAAAVAAQAESVANASTLVINAANAAAASAASAVLAPGTSATSTTSLTVSAGIKSLTIQTGKKFAVGQTVVIADTTAPSTRQMIGIVTAHNEVTGALSVDVNAMGLVGIGAAATWTISLSGARGASSVLQLPMLSAGAALQNLISPMMPIFESSHTIAAVDMIRIMWAGSQFIAVPSTANVNVYTSPDLKVWTARSVNGASTIWFMRNNGANVIACQNSGNAPRKSTDGGVTWSATTVMPGAIVPTNAAYTSSGVFFIGTATSGYVTTDVGTTWSVTQTLPHASDNLFAVGATFVSYAAASGTYYTSTTGLTGSWTARTLPGAITSASIYDDGSGGLILVPNDTTKTFWGTTDGINWTDLGFNDSSYNTGGIGTVTYYVPFKVNGVWCVGSNSTYAGALLVKHAGSKWVPTFSIGSNLSLTTNKHSLVAGNGAGLYGIKPAGSTKILVADGASTKCIGCFV